jgi:hypothetical protein
VYFALSQIRTGFRKETSDGSMDAGETERNFRARNPHHVLKLRYVNDLEDNRLRSLPPQQLPNTCSDPPAKTGTFAELAPVAEGVPAGMSGARVGSSHDWLRTSR